MSSVTHEYDTSEKKLTIHVNDQFNFNIYGQFRDSYRELSTDDVKQIEINLNNTSYIDSAALGMLLLLDEHFNSAPMSITHCSETVFNLLKVANFDRKFTVSD